MLNLDECYKVENKIVENKSTKYQRIEVNLSKVGSLLKTFRERALAVTIVKECELCPERLPPKFTLAPGNFSVTEPNK